jgi:hypothetical protein
LQLIDSYPDKSAGNQVAADIASGVVAAINIFFIDKSTGGPTIYFDKGTHPHAAVRPTYMVFFILENLARFSPLAVDKMEVLRKAELITEILMQQDNCNLAVAFNQVRETNAAEIDRYIKRLMREVLKEPTMSINIFRKNKSGG